MARFRKKPVDIEAQRVEDDEHSRRGVATWCHGYVTEDLRWNYDDGAYVKPDGRLALTNLAGQRVGIIIETLEGTHLAEAGDWIIQGVKGEFYPCKPDIFDQTYEKVSRNG